MASKLKNIFVVTCCVCCFFHLFIICYEYYLNEVDQFVSFDIDKKTEIPRLSVCFEIMKFQSFKNLVILLLNKSNISYEDTFIKLDGKVTLRELWKTLPKPEGLVKKISASVQLEKDLLASPIQYLEYFFEPFYCIAFGTTGKNATYYQHWGVGSSEQGFNYYTIILKRFPLRVHNFLFLFLHPHNTFLNDATLGLKALPLNENTTGCKFSFEISRYSLLPYPYSSDCFNYANIGYQTQSEAITKCVQFLMRAVYNRNLPFTSTLPSSRVFMGYGFILMVRKNITLFDRVRSMEKTCRIKFHRPDCEQSHFDMTNLEVFYGNSEEIEIKMNLVYHPSLHLITKERVELSETIIYSASILGIWFGFSIAFDLPKAANFFYIILSHLIEDFSIQGTISKLIKKLKR